MLLGRGCWACFGQPLTLDPQGQVDLSHRRRALSRFL